MKSLDDDIRDAYAALDRTTPDGYFDTLAARVDDAIASGQEVEAMGPEMTGQMSKNDGTNPPPPGAVETHDENSGLHDIKEMAQSTKKRVSRRVSTQSDAEEALLASASSSSLAAIALPDPDKAEDNYEAEVAPAISTGAAKDEPAQSQGLPVWIYAAGVAAVAAAAVIFFVARGGGDKDETRMAASEAPAAAEAAAELPPAPPPEPEAPATPSAMTDDSAAEEPTDLDPAAAGSDDGTGEMTDGDDDSASEPAVAVKESKPAEDADKPARRSTRSSKGSSSSSTKSDSKAEKRSTAKPKADPKPKKTDDGGKRSLEDLLDEAAGGTVANKDLEAAPKPEKKKPSKTSLTRSDIQNGMRKVLGRVSACQEKHGETGTVMVSVVIQPDGSVSSAKATGKFRGTPTGDCVASAVETASFPAWDGARKSFNYPFLLAQ